MQTAEAKPERSTITILDHTGDMKIKWDPSKSAEVEAARNTFDKMRKQGYLAYTLERFGRKGEVIREFDPDAEKIIMTPPMRGG